MSAFRFVVAPIALLFLSACQPEPAALVASPALERPVVTIAVRNGRLLVPQTVLTELGGAPGVFVVQEGVARFRMIRTGKTINGNVEVLSGLTGRESLVSGDLHNVHDGSPIQAH